MNMIRMKPSVRVKMKSRELCKVLMSLEKGIKQIVQWQNRISSVLNKTRLFIALTLRILVVRPNFLFSKSEIYSIPASSLTALIL